MNNLRKNPLYKSFQYAFEGIFVGIKKERNMKIHCFAMACVITAIMAAMTGCIIFVPKLLELL